VAEGETEAVGVLDAVSETVGEGDSERVLLPVTRNERTSQAEEGTLTLPSSHPHRHMQNTGKTAAPLALKFQTQMLSQTGSATR
jgi:hypothetical protein